MTISDFLRNHTLCPSQIPGEDCLRRLLSEMEQGLRGEGPLPMLPSYLSSAVCPPQNTQCCVLDAGGTNLRSALAVFDENGACQIQNLHLLPMPGTQGPLSARAFYSALAEQARATLCPERVGLCFSYNVQITRTLDGNLLAWCKEVRVPGAVGHPVGASLKEALGSSCQSVHVLNDSVAAMLGASTPERPAQVGVILGTGVNVCYEERCAAIPKAEADLRSQTMIISTEAGEFDGFPKSDLDLSLFAATEDPALAHAEKQCAGGYLGELICRAWRSAAEEGALDDAFRRIHCPLTAISTMLDGADTKIPVSTDARLIAETLIHRAAKMAAILCAGSAIRCAGSGGHVNIAVEGSQFQKLSGFRVLFRQELEALLHPRGITFTFLQSENTCLKGAALAAFAVPM